MNTEVQSKFVSQDNKRILWEIMVENNLFNGIPDKYANNVKQDFEKQLQQMAPKLMPTDNILDLNKRVIMQMIENIKRYTQTPPVQNMSVPIQEPMPYTSAEALTKKQAQFQKGLQTKQEEFNRLIQPVKPTSIDFSDKLDDDPIGSEMDLKLSQTIAWREKQLSQVLEKQNPTEANEWINNGKKVSASAPTLANISAPTANNINLNVKPIIPDNSNHIKIGALTNIDEENIINLKKVSFAEDILQPSPFNFMDKLKKKEGGEELLSIKGDIGVMQRDIGSLQANIGSFQTDIGSLQANIGSFQTDIGSLQTDIGSLQANIGSLRSDLTLMQTDLSKLVTDNKLILENQEKILDKIEQIAFQVGSI